MKRIATGVTSILVVAAMTTSAWAVSAADILARVKKAEAEASDFKAEMVITQANKGNVSGMGEGYSDILKLEKAVIQWKKPNLIRYDGFARGIKAAYIQNGYQKLILAAMIRHKENVKNSPGKRQDSLDLGFLTSQLWRDNTVSAIGNSNGSTIQLKFDPKFGGNDKRRSVAWVDVKSLKVTRYEKYLGSGELRIKSVNGNFQMLGGKLPIATASTMYDKDGGELGSVKYRSLKSNVGLSDALFSMSQR